MTRGSTTSIKDKVLPFFVSCLLWLCWHTLFRHREGTSACCSWFSLCDRPTLAVALRSADRAFSPTRYGSFHSVPFGQRASHCIREFWRYSANMILSQDTFSESVSAFNVSCPLFRLLAHTLIAPRGSICLLLLFPSMCSLSLAWSYITRAIPSSSTKCSQSPQQPYATAMWRVYFFVAPPSPQHVFLYVAPETRNIVPSPIPQGLTRRVTLSLLKCPSRGLPSTNVKGNASTTAVHWMAWMARAEALREGSAVPLLSLPQVSTASPAFASFHIGNPRLGLGFPVLLVSCSFPMLLPSILQVHGHKGCLTPFHGIEDRSI